jgi:hypothetical protein
MTDNAQVGYSITVATDIPSIGQNPPFTIYVVLTASEEEAIQAVQDVIPDTWTITHARPTILQRETVERLGLRPGQVHHL